MLKVREVKIAKGVMTCDVLPVVMCFHLNLAGRCQIFKIIQRWLLLAGKFEHLERGENIHQRVSGSRLVWKGVSLPRCSLMPLSSSSSCSPALALGLGQVPSRLRHRLSFAHTYCSRSSPLFPDPSSFVIHMVCSVLTCQQSCKPTGHPTLLGSHFTF